MALSLEDYTVKILSILRQQGTSPCLSTSEDNMVNLGHHYGVGPYDCAYQIIDDRPQYQQKEQSNDHSVY